MKRIVSIKGGGIRGIIPCCHLVELERQTGALTRDVIDFVGGTSTGALLTACIVAGVPAATAIDVYTEQGPKVFSPTNTVERDAKMVATGHQFDNQVLHQVVSATLGGTTMTMNDSPIGVMITAGDQMGMPWYFVRDAPTNAQTTGKAPLVDAAAVSYTHLLQRADDIALVVYDDHIRIGRFAERHGLAEVRRFANRLQIRLARQQQAQTVAHEGCCIRGARTALRPFRCPAVGRGAKPSGTPPLRPPRLYTMMPLRTAYNISSGTLCKFNFCRMCVR